jgi:hypothetical protein
MDSYVMSYVTTPGKNLADKTTTKPRHNLDIDIDKDIDTDIDIDISDYYVILF